MRCKSSRCKPKAPSKPLACQAPCSQACAGFRSYERQAPEQIQRRIARFRVLVELGFTPEQIAETLNLTQTPLPSK